MMNRVKWGGKEMRKGQPGMQVKRRVSLGTESAAFRKKQRAWAGGRSQNMEGLEREAEVSKTWIICWKFWKEEATKGK